MAEQIKLWTPEANQGQIVVVSYGWLDARLYRCTVDRSRRAGEQESWEVARDSNALRHFQEETDNVIPPKSITWRPCKSPERCYCHGCGELVSRSDVKFEHGEPYCPTCV